MESSYYKKLAYERVVDLLTTHARTCFVKSKENRLYLLNKLILDYLENSKENILIVTNQENFNIVKSTTENLVKDEQELTRLNYTNYNHLDFKEYSEIGLIILNDLTKCNMNLCDKKLSYLISNNENCLVLGTNITDPRYHLNNQSVMENHLFTNRFINCEYTSFEFMSNLALIADKVKSDEGFLKSHDSFGNNNLEYSFLRNNSDAIINLSILALEPHNNSFEYNAASYLVETLSLFDNVSTKENFLDKLSELRSAIELDGGDIPPLITKGDLVTTNPLYSFMTRNVGSILRLAEQKNEDAMFVYFKAKFFNKLKFEENFLENLMELNVCLANNELEKFANLYGFYQKNKDKIIRLAVISLSRPYDYLTNEEKVAKILMQYEAFSSLPSFYSYKSRVSHQENKSL